MLVFLESIAGINLFCYLALNCPSLANKFTSESLLTTWYYSNTSFHFYFVIALFVFLIVGLFGLNKLGFIYHQRIGWLLEKAVYPVCWQLTFCRGSWLVLKKNVGKIWEACIQRKWKRLEQSQKMREKK